LVQVFYDSGRRTEKENINVSCPCHTFPENQKNEQDQQSKDRDHMMMFSVGKDICLLASWFGWVFPHMKDHLITPSIKD